VISSWLANQARFVGTGPGRCTTRGPVAPGPASDPEGFRPRGPRPGGFL